MTLVQEATAILEKMPKKNQQIVVDLLRVMAYDTSVQPVESGDSASFKRTGKSHFDLPKDFDERFDDMNDEIASMFLGESL